MLYRTRIALSIKGDRIEKGREVELSDEELKAFDPNDFEPVHGAPEPGTPEPEPAIEDMNLKQLKAKAEELGLSTEGTKADLMERIALHLQGQENA